MNTIVQGVRPSLVRRFHRKFSHVSHDFFQKNIQDTERHSQRKAALPQVVFVLGGPGVGKGTQCSMLAQKYGFHHLSAGDLLRQERHSPGSEHGHLIDEVIRAGKIVPVEITLQLLRRAMASCQSSTDIFLIDGFPRNQDNVQGWEALMEEQVDLRGVLIFECTEACATARLVERSKTSGRSDDNLESMQHRFVTHAQETMPIIAYYENLNLVTRVSAMASPDQVFHSTERGIQKLLPEKILLPTISS